MGYRVWQKRTLNKSQRQVNLLNVKVLLLSAYDAASHKRWRQGLAAQFPDIEFTQIALAPRFFNWRIRGNSLTYATLQTSALKAHYDLLICTSMVDLSSLRGMVPSLASIPTVLYFHENQFDYPSSRQQHTSVEPQIVTLYSSVCADTVVFNSEFNRRGFLSGVGDLISKLPDGIDSKLVADIARKSRVLPVPLEDALFSRAEGPKAQGEGQPLQIVWNHRWEYDKNPDLLYRGLVQILSGSIELPPFKMHLIGQQFRNQPAVFAAIESLLHTHGVAGEVGFIDSYDHYLDILQRSDFVLSTADHDFQGLSVLEAVALGCIPVLPRHQVYPEMVGERYCYPVTGNLEVDAKALAVYLAQQLRAKAGGDWLACPNLAHLSWRRQYDGYRSLLFDTCASYTEKA
ncbi:DUF3524 domain-containing protein [Gilvimarinus sp. SDUM040013]|uniref:tRNA-queuosine alpha-mannosyltransferase n=1 Tax=Gilvimarinus gilvus TaxID=3058038 RepID=A0ABU4RUB6_9GAMM|nr:DUF3524 domain-containing protein [Gilvimarinus sp. SDUM040013]MDO3385099.1 DUF3524 domain-containing protein [Gilvimarinus sp. SDUM040013]MDX6848474.1 DUF3524 domain-containing protein [Gilvimarinus sp. SDUM040013]